MSVRCAPRERARGMESGTGRAEFGPYCRSSLRGHLRGIAEKSPRVAAGEGLDSEPLPLLLEPRRRYAYPPNWGQNW